MGMTATSVLPSPVFISAIMPSCSTMPPIICTSNGRIPRVRTAPSRATANASGRRSSRGSPFAMRCLNSGVFALSCASLNLRVTGSYELISSTRGAIRLRILSFWLPNIFLRMSVSISPHFPPETQSFHTHRHSKQNKGTPRVPMSIHPDDNRLYNPRSPTLQIPRKTDDLRAPGAAVTGPGPVRPHRNSETSGNEGSPPISSGGKCSCPPPGTPGIGRTPLHRSR